MTVSIIIPHPRSLNRHWPYIFTEYFVIHLSFTLINFEQRHWISSYRITSIMIRPHNESLDKSFIAKIIFFKWMLVSSVCFLVGTMVLGLNASLGRLQTNFLRLYLKRSTFLSFENTIFIQNAMSLTIC